jgi:glycerol transport system ATP-binding protein
VVYATTEASEALLLGGHVATLHQGRVTQFGPSGSVYRDPTDLTTARVFSDPPINIAPARKRGDTIALSEDVRWQAPPALRSLPDSEIRIGLRPHHVTPRGNGGVAVQGPVLISEISGSESVVHFELGGRTWVSQTHGVWNHTVGEQATFALDVARCLYFAPDGRRLAA